MALHKRRNIYVDKKFQTMFVLKFSLVVIAATIGIALAISFLSRDFTTVTIQNTKVSVRTAPELMAPIILETLIVVNGVAAFVVILLTMLTSHKIAGPLYRIKKELDVLKNGDFGANFRIRKTDQLQDLATALTDLAESFRDQYILIKDKALVLKALVGAPSQNAAEIKKRLIELEELLNQYKL